MESVEGIKKGQELRVDENPAVAVYFQPFQNDTLSTTAPLSTLSMEVEREDDKLDFDKSRMTSIVKFFELREIGKQLVIDFVDDVAKSSQRFSNKNYLAQKEEQQKMELFNEKKSFWSTITNTLSSLLGVASICIGASLIATGGAIFPIIAGAALIIAGLASVAATIMEKMDVKNEYTLGVQIFGGIVGLASGGISIATSADKMALVIRIGTALLSVARYSSETISTLYGQKSLMKRAESSELDAEINSGDDQLKIASNMAKEIHNQALQSDMEFIQVIRRLMSANEAANQETRG